MRFDDIMGRLHAVVPPDGWPGVFLLPEAVMRDLYEHVVTRRARRCLELGTGYGATTCVLAAALEEFGGDTVVTVDMFGGGPIDVRVLAEVTQLQRFVNQLSSRWATTGTWLMRSRTALANSICACWMASRVDTRRPCRESRGTFPKARLLGSC